MGTLVLTVEHDLWGLSSSTRVAPLLCLSFGIGVLYYAIYRLHYAWTSRRYVLREDEAVMSLLNAPTEQIRGIVREAVLAFIPLERTWWWWLSTAVCPHDRARRLGLSAEDDWEAIREKILHQTESSALNVADVPTAGLTHAMTTQVTLAMLVTFPVLAILPAIIALAFSLIPTDFVPFWCTSILGGALCAALLILQDNFIATLGYRSLRRHIMAHPSSDAPEAPTFAAIHRPGTGNECWTPSAGVIMIGDSELTFQEKAAAMQVPWQDVESLSFETLGFCGVPLVEVCAEWRDVVEGNWRASSFLPLSGTTALSFNRETLSLLVLAGQKCKTGVFRNGNAAVGRPGEKNRSMVSKIASLVGRIALLLLGISGCTFFAALGAALVEKAIYGEIGVLPYAACGILFCSLVINATFYRLYLWRMNALAKRALAKGIDGIDC